MTTLAKLPKSRPSTPAMTRRNGGGSSARTIGGSPRATGKNPGAAFGNDVSSDSLTAMAEQEITTLSLERYAPDAKALIVATQALADASRHAEVTPLHLLSQCLGGDLAIQEVFRRAAISFTD